MNDFNDLRDTPMAGHNSLAAAEDASRVDELSEDANKLANVVDTWTANVPEVHDEAEAGRARDLLAGLVARIKEVDEARVKEKEPHLAAGRAVDEKFRPIRTLLEACKGPIERLLQGWSDREKARIAAAAAQAKAAADAAQREAEAARKAADASQGVQAAVAAEEALKRADAAAAASVKASAQRVSIKSASGGAKAASPRTYQHAKLTNYPMAARHFAGNVEVVTLLERLATAQIRHHGAAAIPGFEIVRTEKIV